MNTSTYEPLIIRGRSITPSVEDEYGAYIALASSGLAQRFIGNINRDKDFLDCTIIIGPDQNEKGRFEYIEANRLIIESLASQTVGRFYKQKANLPTYCVDMSGKDPYLMRGVIALLHGRMVGVALTELANFIHMMNWLGINFQDFTVDPGHLMTRNSRLYPGNIMKIYRDVLETFEFFVDPAVWRTNWKTNRFSNTNCNQNNKSEITRMYNYGSQF